MKKKIFSLVVAITLLVSMCACGDKQSNAGSAGGGNDGGDVTLYVSAAASMTDSLNNIIDKYTKEHSDVKIETTYDSSGTLKTQIQSGANCDVFISAAQKQMDQLDGASGKCEGENFVLEGTRMDLLENKCVLVVTPGSDKNIKSWEDFEKAIKAAAGSSDLIFCMGNSDVPVGQYTSAILTNLSLNEADLVSKGIITYGSNVKEVTTQVKSGAADCGIIYATDAYSAEMEVTATADSELTGGKVIYPAAVMSNSKNQEAAKEFLDYLKTADAMDEFKAVGFSAAE